VASHEDDRDGIVRFKQLGLEVEAAYFEQPMVAEPKDSMRDVMKTRESSSSSITEIRILARKAGLCGHRRTAGRGSIRISDGRPGWSNTIAGKADFTLHAASS
jgi:hypothetical protein